jgi:hypothetical protein
MDIKRFLLASIGAMVVTGIFLGSFGSTLGLTGSVNTIIVGAAGGMAGAFAGMKKGDK